MIGQVTLFSYGVCGLAFALATVLTAVSRSQNRYRLVLLIANALTSAWAFSVVARLAFPGLGAPAGLFIDVLEHARAVAWMTTVGFILFFAYQRRFDAAVGWSLLAVSGGALVYLLGSDLYLFLGGEGIDPDLQRINFIARVLISVSALLLIENLFRNSGPETRWSVKNLCFGLGLLFGYDFLLYAEAALFGRIDANLYSARGIANALAAPLVVIAAARAKTWPVDLHMSRRLVFHSATLLGAGGYLVAMSAVTYYLSEINNPWGFLLQTSFVTAGVLGLLVILTSESARARARDFISRNFFSYKYDYRLEWLKFIETISDSSGRLNGPERIVRALGRIVDSPSGGIWVYEQEDNAYHAAAAWNLGAVLPGFAASEPFVRRLAASGAVIDLRRREQEGKPLTDLALPAWLETHAKAWLAVPMIHVSGMPAFAVLGTARAARQLNWEDFELLRTAARQAASYIAEELSLRQLARARRFEDFNRQFAFVVHDIKNLAGQMTLILSNAERHGDNPEFQRDVQATIRDSVTRMHQMLEQLRAGRRGDARDTSDLAGLLKELAARWRLRSDRVTLAVPDRPVPVQGDRARLEAMTGHVVGNALDAAGETGHVTVALTDAPEAAGAGRCLLTVTDTGAGMDPRFIEEKLFQPLDSTKQSGYGIGAFQARQLARELGGRLEVDSAIGRGTSIRITLNAAQGATAPAAAMADTVVGVDERASG
ncbi:MAG: PEP-CTERM system histidine kinase PrsK [Rhodospirillaceae bacterium]|nr:PEP-CTERM system histidine kinase PrsK [Rhodospirillaceae bacterium]